MISLTRTPDTCALVEAVHFQPKNAHKTVHVSWPSGKHEFLFMCIYVVLRITLPSGLRFAFDPTGAQNGWQEYLAPWDAYEQHRIHFIKDIRNVRAWGLKEAKEEMKRHEAPIPALMPVLESSLGPGIHDGAWEELFYSLPDARFEAKRESLVKGFREMLTKCVKEVN